VGGAEIWVKKTTVDPPYIGEVSYAGARQTRLILGQDLLPA
jgi:hypothetical protein